MGNPKYLLILKLLLLTLLVTSCEKTESDSRNLFSSIEGTCWEKREYYDDNQYYSYRFIFNEDSTGRYIEGFCYQNDYVEEYTDSYTYEYDFISKSGSIHLFEDKMFYIVDDELWIDGEEVSYHIQ